MDIVPKKYLTDAEILVQSSSNHEQGFSALSNFQAQRAILETI